MTARSSLGNDDLTIDGSGRILVAGSVYYGGPTGYDFAVARYNADGSPDTSFGVGGVAAVDLGSSQNDYADGITLDRQGDILLSGETYNAIHGNWDIGLVRIDAATGVLDTTFGPGGTGVVTTDLGGSEQGYAVAVDPKTDNIVVLAETGSDVTEFVRYSPSGVLDTANFGGGTGVVALERRGQLQPLQPGHRRLGTPFGCGFRLLQRHRRQRLRRGPLQCRRQPRQHVRHERPVLRRPWLHPRLCQRRHHRWARPPAPDRVHLQRVQRH